MSPLSRASLGLRLLALPVALAACAVDEQPPADSTRAATDTAAAASPNVVTVTASDFAFAMPDTLASGLTTFRLVNEGPDLHHVMVWRLDAGHTADELVAAIKAGGPPPAWATAMGGPNSPAPGGESTAELDLTPGDYLAFCMIPSPDGVPHLMKGMARAFTVAPAPVATQASASAAEPAADVRMTLVDYGFEIEPALTAGRHTIRIETSASSPQSHEAFLAKLAPGKTAQDLLAWIEKREGPPPGMPIGGIADLAPGRVNYVTADFTPGEYALICFIPDHKDGKPHFVHGMVRQITVQ